MSGPPEVTLHLLTADDPSWQAAPDDDSKPWGYYVGECGHRVPGGPVFYVGPCEDCDSECRLRLDTRTGSRGRRQ